MSKQTTINGLKQLLTGPFGQSEQLFRKFMKKFLDDNYTQYPVVYVDSANGNDANPGVSSSAPKKTLTGAVDSLPLDFELAIIYATGTFDPVTIKKSASGTIIFIGALQEVATGTLPDADAYDNTASPFHKITCTGLFTAARSPDQCHLRVTWASGQYEYIKILTRVSDNIVEVGANLPANKTAADYNSKAVALVKPNARIVSTTGYPVNIYNSISGDYGSIFFAGFSIEGPDGIYLDGVDNLSLTLCNIIGTSKSINVFGESSVKLGKLSLPAVVSSYYGYSINSGRDGLYIDGNSEIHESVVYGANLIMADPLSIDDSEFKDHGYGSVISSIGSSGKSYIYSNGYIRVSTTSTFEDCTYVKAKIAAASDIGDTVLNIDDASVAELSFILPEQDIGNKSAIKVKGQGASLKTVVFSGKNTNTSNPAGVTLSNGAKMHITDQSNYALLAYDTKPYVQVGSATTKTDVSGLTPPVYKNDLPSAPVGTENLCLLFVEAA
uniref:Uncharacterized protein n=1 Tax=Dictyoglomus turgidum TaxID=513050 RepID=A0A7C3WM51_9BACT